MSLRHVDYVWVGTSVNLFSFALGSLATTLGLNLWWALAACAVGNLTYGVVAFGSIVCVRAGLPVTTLARAAFGMRGNLPNALLSWLASLAFEVINTVFGAEALLALFGELGGANCGDMGKLIAVLLQLMLCGGIAVLGHATMVWTQRLVAALVGIALLIVMCVTLGKVDWLGVTHAHSALSSKTTAAAFLTAAAIIAANPLSFLLNGPDWVRYLPSITPARTIFSHVFFSSYIPSLLLTMMGAACTTLGDMSNPVTGLKPFMPSWLFIVYVVAVIGGSLANTVPTYYSSGLSLQALGLKLRRHTATMLDIAVSTAITLYILLVRDFSSVLTNFIAFLVVWVGPFGGVWICDGYLRRGKYDASAIHAPPGTTRAYWGWRGWNLSGVCAICVGMTLAALTMRSPLYEGPFARSLGGTDLNWIVGFPVAAVVYWALSRYSGRAR